MCISQISENMRCDVTLSDYAVSFLSVDSFIESSHIDMTWKVCLILFLMVLTVYSSSLNIKKPCASSICSRGVRDSNGVVWWKHRSRPCRVHLRKAKTQVTLQDLIWRSREHRHQEKCRNASKQDTAVLSGSVLKDNRNGGRVNSNVNTAWTKTAFQ